MKARVLFAVFGFIFVLLALYVFPPIVLEAVVAALCVIATCEVLGSTKLVHNRLELLLAMLMSLGLAVGHFTVLPLALPDVMQGLVLVMLVGSFAIELKFHDSMKVSQVAWGFFGALLVPYLLLSLLRLPQRLLCAFTGRALARDRVTQGIVLGLSKQPVQPTQAAA